MISTVLTMMLAAAPAPAVLNSARREYSTCLQAFMKSSLKEKMDPAAFDAALAPACESKAQAFRGASIAADTAIGIKRAAAEENAGTELEDLRANTKEYYRTYHRIGSAPEH